jgi:hypothetical protein
MKKVGILCLWSFGIFTAIWYILWPFDNLVAIWYIFPHFGILYKEKSGNPDSDATFGKPKPVNSRGQKLGDQIGRIFASRAKLLHWTVFVENYGSSQKHFCDLFPRKMCVNFEKSVGLHFGRFFHNLI